jgi:Mitochondrial ribosomal protein (VAR1)
MTNSKESIKNNKVKMLTFFESSFLNKMSNADKGKSPLRILKNFDDYINATSLSLRLKSNISNLGAFCKDLNTYSQFHHPFKLVTNLNKPKTKSTVKNISLARSKSDILKESNLIEYKNRMEGLKFEGNLKNRIPLPIDFIGARPLNQSPRNYLNLITSFNSTQALEKNTIYSFNSNNNKLIKNIYTVLEYAFLSMFSLISKPSISITPDKVIIHLFFFFFKDHGGRKLRLSKFMKFNRNRSKNKNIKYDFLEKKRLQERFLIRNEVKLENLCSLLSKIFNKPVELDLVRLYYPFYDPNILVNALGLIANTVKLRFILKRLFKAAIIKNPTRMLFRKRFSLLPGYLAGFSVKFAGRLATQRVVPRKTVKSAYKGSLARGKATLVENSRFTNKNRRGSFSISVTTGYLLR